MSLAPTPDPENRWIKVRCPRCKAMPGFACTFKGFSNYEAVHISRILAFEAYAEGYVDSQGMHA